MRLRIHIDHSIFFLIVIILILIISSALLISAVINDAAVISADDNPLRRALFVLEDGGAPVFTALFVYYPPNEKIAMFTIPGNIGQLIKSLNRIDQIDFLYKQGDFDEYRASIEEMTGVVIPFFASMTLDDFCRATDELGGASVFIPEAVDYTDSGGTRVLLPAGAVRLDGDKMRTYVSYDPNGEYASAESQETRIQNAVLSFFQALGENSSFLLSDRGYSSFRKYFKFVGGVSKKDERLILEGLSHNGVDQTIVRKPAGAYRNVDGERMLFLSLNGQLFRNVVAQTLSMLASQSSGDYARVYSIEVLNGSGRQNAARNAGALFQNFGYDVIRMANADNYDYTKTVVVDRINNADIARDVAAIIRCDNIQTANEISAEENDGVVDFTIILGRDFDGTYVR